MALEIERKFLIKYPDAASLSGEVWEIEQTYLTAPRGETRRVRRIVSGATERFVFTSKLRLSDMTRIEDEREVDRAEYDALLAERDSELCTIRKTRIRIPDGAHVWEVDLFPFWTDRAILEIELSSEDEAFSIPPAFEVIREVTGDRRYTNKSMAKEIPE